VNGRNEKPSLTRKRVLVSGATGFIGSSVTQRLANMNTEVAALSRTRSQLQSVNWIEIISGESFPIRKIADFNPHVVIHLATRFQATHSPADIKELVTSNVELGTNLLESARSLGAVFVNINTAWQHFDSRPYSPVSLYAATKQAFKDIAQYYGETGLDLRNLTIYDTYGPTDRRNKLVSQLLESASRDECIDAGHGDQLINLLFISEVVDAILMIADLPSAPVIHDYVVRAKHSISIRELVEQIETVAGRKLKVNWGTRETRPREMVSDWVFGEALPGWEQRVELIEGLGICWQELNSAT
jgi:nucleoside-diphosphate-sugar epimerase